jgi:hypothetical protein
VALPLAFALLLTTGLFYFLCRAFMWMPFSMIFLGEKPTGCFFFTGVMQEKAFSFYRVNVLMHVPPALLNFQ